MEQNTSDLSYVHPNELFYKNYTLFFPFVKKNLNNMLKTLDKKELHAIIESN
jgi:hypothetical protein